MSLAVTENSTSFSGNGVTQAFPFSFFAFAKSDIHVVLESALGVRAAKALGTDYTLSLSSDDTMPGGMVTMVVKPASGETLFIYRKGDFLNSSEYAEPNAAIERDFDRRTMESQFFYELLGRSFRAPIGETLTELPTAIVRANTSPVFNSSGALTFVSTGNISTLAGLTVEISALAAISASISGVYAIRADVSTVAGIAAVVTTVAGIAASVTTVAALGVVGILNGTGVPSNGLGVNGNFYIDTLNTKIYGPKASGVWPAGVSLIGPSGNGNGDVLKANNLSELTNFTTARSNLGLVIGTNVQAFDSDLAAYAGNSTDGFWAHTGAGAGAARTLAAAIGLTWTNAAGVAGNPSIAYDLASLTEDAATDAAADFVLSYDASATSPKKVLHKNLHPLETWCIALADETTVITTGTGKASWVFPYAFTVVGVAASLNTVSSSGLPTFDIKEAGTTILSTLITIDASEFTGGSTGYQGTAATAAVISDPSIAAFAQMSADISVAGTGAKGAKIYLIGHRT